MFVQPNYLLSSSNYHDYDPRHPNYEANILRLAKKNPRHPEVQKYRQLLAEGQVGTQQLPDGIDQSDEEWCREMLALAGSDGPDSEPEYKSNDEIERAFADGKI